MLGIIKEISGQKTIVPLTADTGAGAPVGSLISMYKKSSPSGYLYCDGSTFDETAYPALYQYLGSNVLPDYRECVAVGAEQNATDTIATHDVYTEGQFKDDQLQQHSHGIPVDQSSGGVASAHAVTANANTGIIYTAVANARSGTTTHGKQKAVFFYIKATSGLTENQQENVLNTINENLSYSTTEHKTGKKWIDGKDIYQKVVENITVTTNWGTINEIGNVVDSLINVIPVLTAGNIVTKLQRKVDNNYIYLAKSSSDTVESTKFIFEYTKTS